MAIQFRKATKAQSKLRMTIDGPAGSGKTFTALTFAKTLAGDGKVAVIDTERGSASKYADLFDFDTVELDSFSPQNYIECIKAAEGAGYAVIVIDSLSHAWEGTGGVLDLHDQATVREPGRNSYTAWRSVTPMHNKLVDAMLQSRCHVIATMRSKMDYIQTEDANGKKRIEKVGMAPIQRSGMEYEFDVVADMDTAHNMVVSKSRIFAIADAVVNKPNGEWFRQVVNWLGDGTLALAPKAEAPKAEPTPEPHKVDVLAIRELVQTEAKRRDNGTAESASEQQKTLIRMFIPEATGRKSGPDADQDRHLFLEYLTGNKSSTEIGKGYAGAILDQLVDKANITNGPKGKEYHISADGKRIVNAVIAEAMRGQGQQELAEVTELAASVGGMVK